MHGQVERWDKLAAAELDAAVIDPNDLPGRKNRYIARLRNAAILEAVRPLLSQDDVVLDFGCGNGGISSQLSVTGCWTLGVDISMGLLKRTGERNLGRKSAFVRYDGRHLPVRAASFKAAVTWVVLNHILDDAELHHLLVQIRASLVPGGRFVAIEQVRRRPTVDRTAWQHRRTIESFIALFNAAGFRVEETAIVRYGRLPMTYAIRYGWLSERHHESVARWERRIGRWLGVLPWDYCDVRFVLSVDSPAPP